MRVVVVGATGNVGVALLRALKGRPEVDPLAHASSVGVYAPGPRVRAIDESWPHTGIATSSYSRDKATVEAMPGWVDMAAPAPLMDTTRARAELDWRPRMSAAAALLDLTEGIHDTATCPTPALR